MSTRSALVSCVAAVLVSGAALGARPQAPATQEPVSDLVKQAQQKLREGKHEEALALYGDELKASPSSFAALNGRGVVLDLVGRYSEARASFTKALEAAQTPERKGQAQRAMAMSYAFEGDCEGATPYEKALYDGYLAAKDFYMAGEIANELARICIEAGRYDTAATWYQTGHDVGLREPDIKPERRDLWEFRQEHALARLAARRGNQAEAQRHVQAAKAIFDKGTNPDQAPFVPYLVGYVAFYGGDYKTAQAELLKGNQRDPFILSLIAQTHEKLGDAAKAMDYYRQVLAINIHNPTGAFSRPLAQRKLKGS
ncbi:MAG: tetratricopeptide repeat protein [Vicinamibacterales bacterium]